MFDLNRKKIYAPETNTFSRCRSKFTIDKNDVLQTSAVAVSIEAHKMCSERKFREAMCRYVGIMFNYYVG